jgi:hypothetical protein
LENIIISTKNKKMFRQPESQSHSCKRLKRFVLTMFWGLIALPLLGQVGGFSGVDDDRDGLPDDFEQAILEKFRPTWKIGSSDCNVLPAEFVPGDLTPSIKDRNGTIYGQVFIRGANALGFFVEAHFYDLWAADCGYVNSHTLDAEHVSVLIRASNPSQPLSEWHASQWYAAAHEDTICDSSQVASASVINAEDSGPTTWVSWGKHGAFFSPQVCSLGGCGLDRCEATTATLTPSPIINIGEPSAPLNGAVWIFSNGWSLAAKMGTDFPAFSTFSSLSYEFPDPGGLSLSTTGTAGTTTVGYASVQNSAGSISPLGISIFGIRRSNVLVTEAAVPTSPLIQSGRIYAEVSSPVNTGLAIVNPNNQPADVAFFFTDSNGQNSGNNTVNIPAKGQLGRFLNESPYNSRSFVRGTFTFSSSVPVSVVALRSFTNERGEVLITTLPVSSLSAVVEPTVVFPQLADGGGWSTQIVLVNPTDDIMSGTIRFFGQGNPATPAEPVELTVNGQTSSTFTYTIAPRSSWLGKTAGVSAAIRVGSAHVTPSPPYGVPSGVAIFSFRRSGIVVTESGAPATSAGSAFRLFADSSGNFNAEAPGSLQTGLAIANLSETPAEVTLTLTTLTGAPMGVPSAAVVPGQGQLAMFLSQLPGFSTLPSTFQGVLRITTNSSNAISVMGLRGRYNERRDFLLATTPAVNESIVSSAQDTLFPYFAEGGGYTTQFILLSPPGGGSISGWLRFYSQTGVPFNLSLR